MTNEEEQLAAAHVRALHKVPGIIVISFEADACQFGFAFADGVQDLLALETPRVLREIAGKIEAGLAVHMHETKLT